MLIFHNYRTPYRDVLFDALSHHIELTVVYLQQPSDENRYWSSSSDSRYQIVQLTRRKIGKFIFNPLLLPKIIRDMNFDTIVFIDNMPNLVMMLVYSWFYFKHGYRVLWTEDANLGCENNFLKKMFQKILRVFILRKMDEIWFFSQKAKIYWQFNYSQKRCKNLFQTPYNKEQLSKINSKNQFQGRRVFGYLGYFSMRKGLFDLIRSVEILLDKNIPIYLKLAGDGKLKKKLQEKESTYIELVGYISDMEKALFFERIDFLVLPSYKDPWGLVINEAMAHGVIPIVSDEVGAKEMVEGIGYIFTSGSVDSLVNGLSWGLNLNDAQMQEYSQLAQQRAKLYYNETNVSIIMS